jgi:PAS domain S-box-containing protein
VLLLDMDGRVVLFNHACERFTGYEFDVIKGRDFWQLCLTEESHEEARSEFARIKAGGQSLEMESEWITRDRERRVVSWHYTPLARNGHPGEFVIVTGNDVTERKRSEDARIREQAGRFAAPKLPNSARLCWPMSVPFWLRHLIARLRSQN